MSAIPASAGSRRAVRSLAPSSRNTTAVEWKRSGPCIIGSWRYSPFAASSYE